MKPDPSTIATTGAVTPELADTVSQDGAAPAAAADRARIGRYRVIRRLGEGGMGVVWEAIDPDLERRVAIKVLRDTRSVAPGDARLRREAQSLAKLSHPNVVSVYDINADAEGELYIVMQLVEGTTLAGALKTSPSRAQLLEWLVQAGRGLAAAHAVGIVHRDFKPANVLVGSDGVVRVSDFGLARASHAIDDDGADLKITRGMAGTPAYMAPEQFLGGPLTAATDQFAFCVTLWEALWGKHPFPGDSVTTIREAVLAGRHRELPPAPRRLQKAVARGLAVAPGDRFASMTELLERIAPRRRTPLYAGLGALALVAGGIAFRVMTAGSADPCATAPLPADAVWNVQRADAIRAAFAKAGVVDAARAPIAALDERTRAWRAARLDTCQATKVRDDQSAELMHQRYLCLDRSLGDERAAIDVLTGTIDRELASRARDLAASGRQPDDCGRDRMGDHAPTSASPLAEALAREAAHFDALRVAGRYREVLAVADSVSARVDAVGDPAIAASWYWTLGHSANFLGETARARAAFRKCAQAATATGDDRRASRAWSNLAEVSSEAGDQKGVDDLLAAASGAAVRSTDPQADIDVDEATGTVALDRGDFPAAIAACQKALAKAERLTGTESQTTLEATACLFNAQRGSDPKAALATGQRVLDITTRLKGPSYPNTLAAMMHLASVKEQLGDHAGALPLWTTALAGETELFGADSEPVMNLLHDRAVAETPEGTASTPEALASIQRAVAISDKVLAPHDPQRAAMLETLAYVEDALHDHEAASASYQRVIALYEQLDDPMGLARSLYNAADDLRNNGHCDRAEPLLRRASKVARDTGQKSLMEAACRGALADCLGKAHDFAASDAAFTDAIATLDTLGNPLFGAQTRWSFADSLAKRHQRARALELAHEAIDELAGTPPPGPDLSKQISDWIKTQ
ncbi:MAG TPA: serine/threonine-protein kinase [Kofleriaceae bacterium]|nr:serine/threonine-protein kinase [Kofleriaceae bacterium]